MKYVELESLSSIGLILPCYFLHNKKGNPISVYGLPFPLYLNAVRIIFSQLIWRGRQDALHLDQAYNHK